MNYKSFNLGDWIGHISGVIEDETTLDGNEMRDLVEFLSTLKQEHCEDAVSRQAAIQALDNAAENWNIAEPYHEGIRAGYRNSARLIMSLPSTQPSHEQKTMRF